MNGPGIGKVAAVVNAAAPSTVNLAQAGDVNAPPVWRRASHHQAQARTGSATRSVGSGTTSTAGESQRHTVEESLQTAKTNPVASATANDPYPLAGHPDRHRRCAARAAV